MRPPGWVPGQEKAAGPPLADDGEYDEEDTVPMPTGTTRIVFEFRVDTGTLAELRNIE